jgi:hypothetical protein
VPTGTCGGPIPAIGHKLIITTRETRPGPTNRLRAIRAGVGGWPDGEAGDRL